MSPHPAAASRVQLRAIHDVGHGHAVARPLLSLDAGAAPHGRSAGAGQRSHTEGRAMAETERRQESGSGREIVMLVGILVLVAAGTMTTYWVRSGRVEAAGKTVPAVSRPAEVAVRAAAPAPVPMDVVHTDVYFDFKSTRLRADAVRTLQEKATAMERSSTWGVLVQGYADSQGPAEYNRVLALRRAEAVKQFLVELGVPEASVKVATVGAEGTLCDEATRECQQLNRRVHLEIRRLRTAATPAVRPVLATEDTLETTQGR
jgi:outer membrane protein OmpA-like peptidoglycan-associated protein